jgi:large-conductance mechanosensitive channel
MLTIITFTLIILVAINFLLLAFSCNKIVKSKNIETKTSILLQAKTTNEQAVTRLAPTGS